MRAWIGTALLAVSWLFGVGYFQATDFFAWFCLLVAGTVLLADVRVRFPGGLERFIALLFLLPAIWYVPFPHKAVPALLAMGTVFASVPIPRRWPKKLAQGATTAGVVLLPQSLILLGYQTMTARAHELPAVFVQPLVLLAKLIGADAATDGTLVSFGIAQDINRVTATWELLFDPATVGFAVGGLTLIAWSAYQKRHRPPARGQLRVPMSFLACVLAWAPLRLVLLVSLVFQQIVRADAISYPNVGEILVNHWVQLILLVIFAFLVGNLISLPTGSRHNRTNRQPRPARRFTSASCCTIAVAFLTVTYFWVPVGDRKQGRVIVVERHSTWEPTTVPYGTEQYGEAGSYNYAAIYNFCSQYYQMSRLLETDPIDSDQLRDCDILVIKTPTSRYLKEEVEAIERFVERGGSLLMIGDHTNVFNMNTYLNDVARRFGFTFRNDLLFRIGNPYRQEYLPPKVSHPILQDVPPMTFAVSCSIDPGGSSGTMVVRNTGLWSLPPAYHETNYHPQAEYRSYMQSGAWCQLWSTVHGKGRVLAFADSTLFSNFCTFQPGKSELFVGMVEWLNHSSPLDSLNFKRVIWIPLISLSIVALGFCLWLTGRDRAAWLLPLAVGWASWTVAAQAVTAVHRQGMPYPPSPPTYTKIPHVVIDRTVSDVPLFTGAFAENSQGDGYGMLEQWIPRVGNYVSRGSGDRALMGDGLVIICPTRLPSRQHRERLVEWVESGGRLLVLDTPDVTESTANSILMLFGLHSIHDAPEQSDQGVRLADGSLETGLMASCEIAGGEPIALWGDIPVAARKGVGRGSVTAIGFGSLFNDAAMGYHWLPQPEPDVLQRYEFLYALLRAALE